MDVHKYQPYCHCKNLVCIVVLRVLCVPMFFCNIKNTQRIIWAAINVQPFYLVKPFSGKKSVTGMHDVCQMKI